MWYFSPAGILSSTVIADFLSVISSVLSLLRSLLEIRTGMAALPSLDAEFACLSPPPPALPGRHRRSATLAFVDRSLPAVLTLSPFGITYVVVLCLEINHNHNFDNKVTKSGQCFIFILAFQNVHLNLCRFKSHY